jgi:nicotinate-nucleotide--dimethylbenzimidazole phosphoribosyltransferase
MNYKKAIREIKGADREAMEEAREYCDTLIKPLGSLGKLEDIAIRIAGITGNVKNTLAKRAVIVMAADNGVYENCANRRPPLPERDSPHIPPLEQYYVHAQLHR